MTELCLTQFRAYDPELGRWLSRDPLRNAEELQGFNLYAYVGNNPIGLTDPLGRQIVPPKASGPVGPPHPQCSDVLDTLRTATACVLCVPEMAAAFRGGSIETGGNWCSICFSDFSFPDFGPEPFDDDPDNCDPEDWGDKPLPIPCNPAPMCQPPPSPQNRHLFASMAMIEIGRNE